MSKKYPYPQYREEYHKLTKRQRHICYLYLVSRMSWAEIRKELGVSRERVRQLKNLIFGKLNLDVVQEKKRVSLISIAKRASGEYDRAYNKKHKADRRAYKKRYRETHYEQVRARERDWARRNKDRVNERQRRYYQKHKEKRLAYQRAYQKAHPEKVRVWQKRCYDKRLAKLKALREEQE